MTWRPSSALLAAVAGLVVLGTVSSCGPALTGSSSALKSPDSDLASVGVQAPSSGARVLFSPGDPKATVNPDTTLKVVASGGRLTTVSVKESNGTDVAGALSPAGDVWTSNKATLPFGETFTAQATAVDPQGISTNGSTTFRVRNAVSVKATITPSEKSVVGVAMPIIVRFNKEPSDRASVEAALSVRSTPEVTGSWGWVGSQEVHWRPKAYWPAGTDVTVRANLADLSIGNDQTGDANVVRHFTIGQATVIKVGIDTHELRFFQGGALVRTIPVTTGKVGFGTRSGIKVIMNKERTRIMDSVTVDIPAGSSDAYRLKVEYAMRLTNSGEFIHAAPWSVGAQGRANVSHGCTGMSMSNAAWLFERSKIGDPVEYTGSVKPMTLTNGYGDWNLTWNAWGKRSAAV